MKIIYQNHDFSKMYVGTRHVHLPISTLVRLHASDGTLLYASDNSALYAHSR